MNGKKMRLARISRNGKFLIIPMDHGFSEGPMHGLENIDSIISKIEDNVSAVILHKGIIHSLKKPPKCGVIMHLNASTRVSKDPNRKILVSSINSALRLGVDAVSFHCNIGGSDYEPDMLSELGMVADLCIDKQIPLLAMMYARGNNITKKLDSEDIALAARVGAEAGADIVKVNYTGDSKTFKNVVNCCPVPVVIAGGAKYKTEIEFLEMVEDAMQAGANGFTIGRNVFQHSNPSKITMSIRKIVLDGLKPRQILSEEY